MPMLLIHGTEDFIYNGRPDDLYSADETLQIWAEVNGCNSEPEASRLPDLKDDNTTVDLITWSCPADMAFYKINGGGHHWPGAEFNADRWTKLELGNYCRDFEASQAIWDFCSKH